MTHPVCPYSAIQGYREAAASQRNILFSLTTFCELLLTRLSAVIKHSLQKQNKVKTADASIHPNLQCIKTFNHIQGELSVHGNSTVSRSIENHVLFSWRYKRKYFVLQLCS
jgi:hypothetical protein